MLYDEQSYADFDPKTKLQELVQKEFKLLQVLRHISRRQKLQFLQFPDPKFKDSKIEKKFFESLTWGPQIQRFKDSKIAKIQRFKESKTQRLQRSSLNLLLGDWGFDSKNFYLGTGASIQ